MSYSHVLVAVDFNKGTKEVVDKAIKLAKSINAKVSLIHIDNQITDEATFGGLIDTDLAEMEPEHPMSSELKGKLDTLVSEIDYPIEQAYLIKGCISHAFEAPVKEANIDLIVCGHHHNLWSRLKPSARELINTSLVDLLIVSLPE